MYFFKINLSELLAEKQNIMKSRSSIFMAKHFFASIAGRSLPSGPARSGTG